MKREWILGIVCAIVLVITILGSGFLPKLWAYYQYEAGNRDCWGEYSFTGDHSVLSEVLERFEVFIEDTDGTPLVVTEQMMGTNGVIWMTDATVGQSTDGSLVIYSGADNIVDDGETFAWTGSTDKNKPSGGGGGWTTAPKTIPGTFPKVSSDITSGTSIGTFKGRTNISRP